MPYNFSANSNTGLMGSSNGIGNLPFSGISNLSKTSNLGLNYNLKNPRQVIGTGLANSQGDINKIIQSNIGATSTTPTVINPPTKNSPTNSTPKDTYINNLANPTTPTTPTTPPAYNTQTGTVTDYGKSINATPMSGGKPIETPVPTNQPPTNTPPPSSSDVALSKYLESLQPSDELAKTQKIYEDYVANTNKTLKNTEDQTIPMPFITGQKASIADRANIEANRLQGNVGIAQQSLVQKQNALKTNLDYQQAKETANKPVSLGAGNSLVNPKTGQIITTAPPQTTNTSTSADAQSVADGIIKGIIPPDLTKNVSFRDRTAVNAILAKAGYDLSTATQDWTATQKYISTLNGAQQMRLRQAVNFAYDSLDIVDTLNSDLTDNLKRSGITVINKANMTAAKQGVYGNEAKQAAIKLDSQISDLVSELATVYKGGNSSTDEGLKLAAKQLDSNWDAKTLTSAVNLVRKNLAIRKNSIANTGVGGIDTTNNAYSANTNGTSGSATGGSFAEVW